MQRKLFQQKPYLLIGKMFSRAAATFWRLAKGLWPKVLLLAVLSLVNTLSLTFAPDIKAAVSSAEYFCFSCNAFDFLVI